MWEDLTVSLACLGFMAAFALVVIEVGVMINRHSGHTRVWRFGYRARDGVHRHHHHMP